MNVRSRVRPVAVLDIGSNSVRLDVRVTADPKSEVMIRRKSLCRLGKDMTLDNALSKTRMDYTLKTLKKYKRIIDGNDVEKVKAVATAAVRSASNGQQFIQMVNDMLGLSIDVIEGDEEARLVALGVISSLSFPFTGLVADLGGGSLELVRVENNKIKELTSLPLGLQRIPDTELSTRQFIWGHLDKLSWLKKETPYLVCVGGTWRACAKLDQANLGLPLGDVHEHKIDSERTVEVCDWLITETFKKSKARDAIEKHRQKEIPLAAFVLKTLHSYCHKPAVLFSQAGIREGCFVDMQDTQAVA